MRRDRDGLIVVSRVYYMMNGQVEEFARSRDLSIVGVSYGNELVAQESNLTQWPVMMGGKIAEQFASPVILVVRNVGVGWSTAQAASHCDACPVGNRLALCIVTWKPLGSRRHFIHHIHDILFVRFSSAAKRQIGTK
jgi:hypothetical protein